MSVGIGIGMIMSGVHAVVVGVVGARVGRGGVGGGGSTRNICGVHDTLYNDKCTRRRELSRIIVTGGIPIHPASICGGRCLR
jgi:hypothetical protein